MLVKSWTHALFLQSAYKSIGIDINRYKSMEVLDALLHLFDQPSEGFCSAIAASTPAPTPTSVPMSAGLTLRQLQSVAK